MNEPSLRFSPHYDNPVPVNCVPIVTRSERRCDQASDHASTEVTRHAQQFFPSEQRAGGICHQHSHGVAHIVRIDLIACEQQLVRPIERLVGGSDDETIEVGTQVPSVGVGRRHEPCTKRSRFRSRGGRQKLGFSWGA